MEPSPSGWLACTGGYTGRAAPAAAARLSMKCSQWNRGFDAFDQELSVDFWSQRWDEALVSPSQTHTLPAIFCAPDVQTLRYGPDRSRRAIRLVEGLGPRRCLEGLRIWGTADSGEGNRGWVTQGLSVRA
ncbi:hypothetical protein Bbelb_038660 [Branchiostoma belcheri]|nr:hypothetical protein Bbelb_038660 [Branchiostoma belcheri]